MKKMLLLSPLVLLLLAASPHPQNNASRQVSREIEPVLFSEVTITDNFWKPRLEKHATNTLRVCMDQIENQTGRIRNFENAARRSGKHEGIFFDDSDVYKAMEGMAYSLIHYRNPVVESKLDEWTDKIAAAQLDDGYINTYYILTGIDQRWTDMDKHEMYCAGHLIEAAVAYYQATGKRKLLDVAIKMADHMDRTFGPNKRHWVPGHQEIELALVKLYHVTSDERYLHLSNFLLEERGRGHGYGALWEKGGAEKLSLGGAPYCQDAIPVADQCEISGHAVRAMYLFCGMADVASLTENPSYIKALDRLWRNVVYKNMYITGGIGSSKDNEGFSGDYNLPNKEAYCETCASVGMVLWNARMNQLTGLGKYVNVLERALYNGTLAGINLQGDRFFYVNPLESEGKHHRKEWYGCACCPSQLARFLPSIGSYIYGANQQGVYVNLYIASTTTIQHDNIPVKITQESNYPWEGTVQLKVDPKKSHRFRVALRMPVWSNAVSIGINGKLYKEITFKDGYAYIDRTWKKGDHIELNLDMGVKVIAAHPRVAANWGRRAVQRGPLVYCAEEIDNKNFDHNYIYPLTSYIAEYNPALLGGVETIEAKNPDNTRLHFIPYFVWDNRDAGRMEVWVKFDEEEDIY